MKLQQIIHKNKELNFINKKEIKWKNKARLSVMLLKITKNCFFYFKIILFRSEPILLLDFDTNGKIVLNTKALKFLSSIDTNIAVLTIAGPYRTGKSYLLNRFASTHYKITK